MKNKTVIRPIQASSAITLIEDCAQHGMPRQSQAGFLAAAYFIETHRSEGTNQGEGGGQRISEITEAKGGSAKDHDDTTCSIDPAKNQAVGWRGAEIA